MSFAGVLGLLGGAEMTPPCRPFDVALWEACARPPLVNVVTAAVQESGDPTSSMGQAHAYFEGIGARAQEVALRRRADASRDDVVEQLAGSRLTYLLGGNPGYLLDCLQGTRAWVAMRQALGAGGGLAGSSAGAMVICDALLLRSRNPRPASRHARHALGLLGEMVVIPHFRQYGGGWIVAARREMPGADVLGLDEASGIMYNGRWTVHGPGEVRLFRRGRDAPTVYRAGGRPRLRAPVLV